MPGWSVADDEAKLVGLPLPEYLAWAATEDGACWLERLRIKWAIVAAARKRDAAEAARAAEEAALRRQGWHGGRTAPAGHAVRVAEAA